MSLVTIIPQTQQRRITKPTSFPHEHYFMIERFMVPFSSLRVNKEFIVRCISHVWVV